MKKYFAPIICGFSIGIIQNIPIIGSFSCCILLPLAVFYSLVLDQKATKNYDTIKYTKGLLFGLLTGLAAALIGSTIDIILTLMFKSNSFTESIDMAIQKFEEFPLDASLKKLAADTLLGAKDDILKYGFSLFYTFSMFVDQIIINSIFGPIGGLIGVAILNSNKNRRNNTRN